MVLKNSHAAIRNRKAENPTAHDHPLHIGHAQALILQIIDKLGHDAFGLRIYQTANSTYGLGLSQPQVYVALKRMVRRGLIVHTETRVVENSPPLKVYKTTALGKRARAAALAHLRVVLNTIMETKENDGRAETPSAQQRGHPDPSV